MRYLVDQPIAASSTSDDLPGQFHLDGMTYAIRRHKTAMS